jgi:hypothetical protein
MFDFAKRTLARVPSFQELFQGFNMAKDEMYVRTIPVLPPLEETSIHSIHCPSWY